MSPKDILNSEVYSDQFLLLLAQLVHESAVDPLTTANAKPILQKLKAHPIVTRDDCQLRMTEAQFVKLYSQLLEENGLADQVSLEDSKDEDENTNYNKVAPLYATQLCEILYAKRLDEIKAALAVNKGLFKSQLTEIEQK